MKSWLEAALGAAMMTLVAGSAMAQFDDGGLEPAYLRIRGLTDNGSGCPLGSVASNVSPDATAFTLIFDNYVAEAGPGVSLANSRKNCQLALDLDYPDGWSFSVVHLVYRGYVSLDPLVNALQKSTFYFQGSAAQESRETPFYGAQDTDFTVEDYIPTQQLIWSPCHVQRALNINSQVRLDTRSAARNARGLITTDSIDGETQAFTYGLAWQRCN